MIITQNQQYPKSGYTSNFSVEMQPPQPADYIKPHHNETPQLSQMPALLLPGRIVTHHPAAGINPIVDAASYLFSLLGKLKQLENYHQLNTLQQQLITEISTFQENIKRHGYNKEYLLVCHYIICATFDDVISNTSWGSQGQWDNFGLLTAFKQDPLHHQKFFNILERAIKEPSLYIDLMELVYICLSLGYKGPYRATEHNHYLLEQITSNLYKHIRSYRGNANRSLSPAPLRKTSIKQKYTSQGRASLLTMSITTACIMMTMFISLGYLMDIISNESFEHLAQINTQHTQEMLA